MTTALAYADDEDPGNVMETAIDQAARLVGAVHEWDATDVAAILDGAPPEAHHLLVALAAMVDPERTLGEALGWTRWAMPDGRLAGQQFATIRRSLTGRQNRNPREHGTERGYKQHRYHQEEACIACLDAHADHNRAPDGARRNLTTRPRQLQLLTREDQPCPGTP